MTSGDTLRWLGTLGIAGALGLVAFVGIVLLALNGKPVPDVLNQLAVLAGGAFFTAVGAMIGARASQNGQQIASGQPPSGHV